MSEFICPRCGATAPVPRHCGRPMQLGNVGGRPMLVCWMGPECGAQPLPEHCGVAMQPRS